MAQGGGPGPKELWTFETDGGAAVNDVAIDADGKVITAVQGDGSAVEPDDDEVYAWNLDRSKTSSSPTLRDDPSDGLGDPEGLGIVAIEANPGGRGDFIAVGNEGSSDDGANNVYVYRRSAGPGSVTQVTYPDGRSAPGGAVEDIWFLDRNTLLVYHEGSLSLLKHDTGTEFNETEDGRWSPSGEETIRDVSVSNRNDRVAVLSSRGGNQASGDDTLVLRLFEEDNGKLTPVAVPWTREGLEPAGQTTLSRNGQYALVGTGSNTFYYMGLQDYKPSSGEDNPPPKQFSELPWSRNGPDDVADLALGPNGAWLAASFANGELVVYQRTKITDEGPRAERVHDSTVQTNAPAEQMSFADGNESLIVQGAGLMAFHAQQFKADEDIRPLWRLPDAQGFAVSDDGQRLAVAATDADGNGVVRAYERSYDANLSLQTPSTVQPSRAFNVTATIENRGSNLDAFRLAVDDLGSAWNIEAPDQPLQLLPGEEGNTTLQITPGATQAPGEVSFSVRAVSQASPDKRDVASEEATVTVQEVHAAEVSLDTGQRSVSQGGTLTLEPEVTNTGNTAEPIVLRVRQDASWTVAIDGEETSRTSFQLDPGASANPTVEVTAPSDAPKGTRNTFKLVAHPEEGGNQDTAEVPVVVDPSYAAAFEVPSEPVDVEAGETVSTDVTLLNDGNTRDTFRLEVESNASNPQHLWSADLSPQSVTLEDQEEETITVTVDVPRGAVEGDSATVTLRATSSASGDQVGEASYTLQIPEETEDSPTSALAALAAVGLAALAARRQQR